jgi:hypothetical protein
VAIEMREPILTDEMNKGMMLDPVTLAKICTLEQEV